MKQYAMIGLLKIELPSRTIRLCDGGFIYHEGDLYRSKDQYWGTISGLQGLSEGVGDEVPALELVFLPTEDATPVDLCQPGFQKSRARLWIGEYDIATNNLDGTPDLMFDGQLDQTKLIAGRETRRLSVSVVSTAERLFERNVGNSLSPSFHKSIWSGETGHDNATGLKRSVAWGVEKPGGQSQFSGWRPTPLITGPTY